MKTQLITCEYVNENLKDEVVVKINFEGKAFKGTLSEVFK